MSKVRSPKEVTLTVDTNQVELDRKRRASCQHVTRMEYDAGAGKYKLYESHEVKAPLISSPRVLQSHAINGEMQNSGVYDANLNFCKRTHQSCRLVSESLIRHMDKSWFFLIVLGVSSAFLSWLVDEASTVLHRAHIESAKLVAKYSGWWISYLLYVAWTTLGTIVGIAFCSSVHPDSRGSGISQMKTILQGISMPNVLGWRTLVTKAVGLLLARGSSLNVGSEGPFVIMSASLATIILDADVSGFRVLRENPMLRRDILAAAAAAGVAATFGAPIGGVLFSIEVTSTYFMISAYWKGFFCAVCGAVVFQQLGVFSHNRDNEVSLFTTAFEPLPYSIYEFIPFMILATLCGALGGWYVRFQRNLLTLSKRYCQPRQLNWCPPFVFPGIIVAFMTAFLEYPLGSFMNIGLRHGIDDLFHEGSLTEKTVTHADDWTSGSLIWNLFTFTTLKFALSAMTCLLPLPYGVIVPVFAVGAGLGRLFGEILLKLGMGAIIAGGYAVVGAASFTAGVTHTVSIAVIVFELTAQLSYMLPVLMGAILARGVASLFAPGIFSQISNSLGLPEEPSIERENMYGQSIMSIANVNPPFIVRRIILGDLIQQLHEWKAEKQWAIVDDETTMVMIGTASRIDLLDVVDILTAPGESVTNTGIVDLVSCGMLDLDFSQARVRAEDPLSNVLLHFSVTSDPLVFVTERGRLKGIVRSSDLTRATPLWYDAHREGSIRVSHAAEKYATLEFDD